MMMSQKSNVLRGKALWKWPGILPRDQWFSSDSSAQGGLGLSLDFVLLPVSSGDCLWAWVSFEVMPYDLVGVYV